MIKQLACMLSYVRDGARLSWAMHIADTSVLGSSALQSRYPSGLPSIQLHKTRRNISELYSSGF